MEESGWGVWAVQEALVLAEVVEGVEHLDHHQDAHGHRAWVAVQEDGAAVRLLPLFARAKGHLLTPPHPNTPARGGKGGGSTRKGEGQLFSLPHLPSIASLASHVPSAVPGGYRIGAT